MPVTPEPSSRQSRALSPAVALGGAVLVGVLTALQARINGQLGLRLGDGFVAAAISFSLRCSLGVRVKTSRPRAISVP